MGDVLRKGRWALAGTAAVAVLLLMPLPASPEGSLRAAAGDAAHVWLFAALAWLWGRILPGSKPGLPLWLALALLAAGLEWLQTLTGRSVRLADGLMGAAGAACICATGAAQRFRRRMRWGALLILCLAPLAWSLTLAGLESRAFPVLAAPNAAWVRHGWTLNGVRLVFTAKDGLRFERDPVPGGNRFYPGAFRASRHGDWRGVQSFRASLYWPMEMPAVFAVRVDDRPGNPPYADRFQREFAVSQGWNSVSIPAAELQRTASGRLLTLGSGRQWGVFLVSEVPFDYFLVGPVRLELQKETP